MDNQSNVRRSPILTNRFMLRVSLPTKEAQQSIKFALARAGKETAVLINRLAGGTAAAEVDALLLACLCLGNGI